MAPRLVLGVGGGLGLGIRVKGLLQVPCILHDPNIIIPHNVQSLHRKNLGITHKAEFEVLITRHGVLCMYHFLHFLLCRSCKPASHGRSVQICP